MRLGEVSSGDCPDGFWELHGDADVTTGYVHAVAGDMRERRVLYQTRSATHHYSLFLHRNHSLWKAASLISRVVARVRERGWRAVWDEAPRALEPARTPALSAARVSAFALRCGRRYLADGLARNLLDHRWEIGYRRKASPPREPTPFTFLQPRDLPVCADPFPIEVDNVLYVFFEAAPTRRGIGKIAHVSVAADGSISSPRVVLDEPFHVSYPFVFAHGDDVFMLPEMGQSGEVSLYRAVRFPDRWARERTLLSGMRAADPTLVEHDDRLWLFVTISASAGPAIDELHLFSAPDLSGEWRAHRQNPVVSDVRRARAAGRVFLEGHSLIRPSQDCSRRYGGRILLNRILTMNMTEYREEPIGAIDPQILSGRIACHTYNACGGTEWIDGLRRVPRIPRIGRA